MFDEYSVMSDDPIEVPAFTGDELAERIESGTVPTVDLSVRCDMCNRERELSSYDHPMDHPELPEEIQLCDECSDHLDEWDQDFDEICDVCRPHPQEATHRSDLMSQMQSDFDEDERAEMLCEGHSRYFPDSERRE